MSPQNKPYGHAVVIGGSMTGLLAARVLADHFTQVTLVERDTFPTAPDPRKGVPQARHAHVLLVRGQRILNELLPGLPAELAVAGAPTVDWGADVAWHTAVGWAPRAPSDMITQTCSRDLLEWQVRQRLMQQHDVRFITNTDVQGLRASANGRVVTGVHLRDRRALAAGTEATSDLVADLVVDASGRSSRLPEWLAGLGYDEPQETIINSFLSYASRWYRKPTDFQADWKVYLVSGEPLANPRAGVIYPIEGDRWIVTLAGIGDIKAPTDEAGFLEFTRQMSTPGLYDIIREAEPLTPIYGYQRTENRLRHYEKLDRWPEGLVVLGDAVCGFNPVYGQGMTVGAMGVQALDKELGEQARRQPSGSLDGLGRHFQHTLAEVNQTPWLMATGEDMRYPTTVGGRPARLSRVLQIYLGAAMEAGASNHQVQAAVREVMHLLRPPAALFRPGIVAQVAVTRVRQARGAGE
jgi:2-polyprenyl-6-methoxyphenol hydroxylase-like FAD-dependent oxidoreductase